MAGGGVLIGRSRELRAVTAVLDTADAGAAAVVVRGEAGIGKTTLLDAVVRWARQRSSAVAACRPAQPETALSFGALADLMTGVPDEVLVDLPATQRRTLDTVCLRIEPDDSALELRAVGTALCSALAGIAARTPLLVVVDDAQWLDRPSEQALRFAVRRLVRHPVAFVVSVRSGEGPTDPLGLDAALPGGCSQVAIGGLSLGALRELLSVRLGVAMARPLLVRLARTTGGNPFYALELTRALAAKDLLEVPTVAMQLPGRLHELVADRIASLDRHAARACLVAAAVARPTVDLLLAATDAASWADSGAAAAEDAGIIRLDRAEIKFTHPLLRSAVYESARPSARRAVHARLADVVTQPDERARHLADSVTGSDLAVAAALDVGAEHAWRRGALEPAADLAERALALTPATEPRNRRRLVAAGFQYEAANPTRSRTLLQQVLDDDPTRTERLEAVCRLGSVRFYVDRLDRSIDLLSRALDELYDDEHALRARLETELAYSLIAQGDSRGAVDHAERAVAAARAVDATALVRAAAAPLVWASLMAGQGVMTDMVELCLTGGEPTEPFAIDPQMQAGAVLKWGDQLDRARSVLTGRYELALARGAVAKLPLLAWHIADVEVLAGRWDSAEVLAEEALEGARFRGRLAVALCAALRGRIHALRGRLDAARVDVDEASEAGKELGGLSATTATEAAVLFHVCRDDPSGVHAVAGPLVADLHDLPPSDPALLRWMPDEVEALVRLGSIATASEVLDWFEERCHVTDRRSGWAAAHRCRALLASHEGALDRAAEHIAESSELYAAVGMPFDRARSLVLAGGIHRRRRQKGDASAALEQAGAIFDELGAGPWARRARDELDQLGHGKATRNDALTAVEAEVARRVAAGLRNREVATELFMSPKTVESHLTRIYRKLGIRSRTELAAALLGIGSTSDLLDTGGDSPTRSDSGGPSGR